MKPRSANGNRHKWERGLFGQRWIWGPTVDIFPVEYSSVFRLVIHHFFVSTFEEATLQREINQEIWIRGQNRKLGEGGS